MSAALSLSEIERILHEKIPLTRAMELRVESYDGEQIVLTAPLAANHNHLGTAFGGSLAAMAMVAGYGLVWLMLGDRDGHVVIRDSTISFRRPVRTEIRASCRQPDEATVAAFKAKFLSDGTARLRLEVAMEENHRLAASFEGTFVATR
jgi:thioesterase domain-containing protein